MYIMERLRADGRMHRSLLNLRPLPDPAHVGKCMWDGLCNWVLVMDDNRICMQFLRTLREALPELAKLLPLFPLTCRDQQAPENLLHASTEPVMQQLQGIARVCHQICPEKWRKWDGNNRELEHPLAVATQPQRLAFLEADTGRISLGSWHTPFDVKQSSTVNASAHGLTFVGHVLIVTVPGSATIQYLETKAGGGEIAVGKLPTAELKQMLHDRDVETAGLSLTEMRRELTQRLQTERERKFGLDPGADEKERKQSRSTRPRLRPLTVHGDQLKRPLAVAAHPSERRIAVAEGDSKRIAVVELKTQGVQLMGTSRFVCGAISPTADLNSLCWITDDLLAVADSSPGGGIWSVDVNSGVLHLQLRSGSQLIEGKRLPMKPWGVCSSAGQLYYTDATERTVRQVTLTANGDIALPLIAGSGDERARDGTEHSCSFVQPTGIAADGQSLLVCDTGAGRICVVSRVRPLKDFLGHLRRLYETFGLHLRGKVVARRSLVDGIADVSAVATALAAQTAAVRERVGRDTVNGPDGAISNDSGHSLRIIRESLQGVRELFARVVDEDANAADYASCFALKACSQNPLEHFFAKIHVAEAMPTVLQYGQLKAPATLELIKQLTRCSFSYPTPKQFYTDPTLALPFSSIKLPRKKTAAKLRQQRKSYTEAELRERREYMALYFRPAPQAAVRSFCKFKAGTPPLSAFGHRVELKSRPLDLDQRMEDLSDNAGLPLPDRKRNAEPAADPDFVFLAVLPGGQPAGIALEDIYVVAVDGAYYDNPLYDPLAGFWMVPNYDDVQVFQFMAAADLRREHILAEISVEGYQDEQNRLCAAVDEATLHRLLVAARKSAEEGSVRHDEDPRLESDAFPYFGVSQATQSQGDYLARDARAARRDETKAARPETGAKPKPKAKPKAKKKPALKGKGKGKRKGKGKAKSKDAASRAPGTPA
jgi:hypothetical protein